MTFVKIEKIITGFRAVDRVTAAGSAGAVVIGCIEKSGDYCVVPPGNALKFDDTVGSYRLSQMAGKLEC